jgi:hypothetical protein
LDKNAKYAMTIATIPGRKMITDCRIFGADSSKVLKPLNKMKMAVYRRIPRAR